MTLLRRAALLMVFVPLLLSAQSAAPPLGLFAQRSVLVFPTQGIQAGDSLGWASGIPDIRGYLATLDDELAFAFQGRQGLSKWTFARGVETVARRAGSYAPAVHELAVRGLLGKLDEKTRYAQPALAEALRTVGSLTDARWALIPVELRFEKVGSAGRVILRAAFVDVRAGEVGWAGDVVSDTSSHFSPKLLASVATRLADLIAVP